MHLYIVHSNTPPHCTCNKFQSYGRCLHASGEGVWQATYIVNATTSKQAEEIVEETTGRKDRILTSFPIPYYDHPKIVLETWRDQVRV